MSAALSLPFAPPAGRPLLDIPKNGCRYAVGEDDSGRHLFCGEPATRKSWCSHHADIVFTARDVGGMSLAQARASGRVAAEGSRRG